jgi:FkbM family methyltransferase
MANIKILGEHSIAVNLLTGGICIDVGCRGFQFSEALRDLGCEVWAFDMEEFEAPAGINYRKMAVSDYTGFGVFKDTKDLQAKHLIKHGSGQPVSVISLNDAYGLIGSQHIDVLKLDVEGEEYHILSDPNFQPIPRQISIEFHMHCHRALHDQYYDKRMENLLKYYVPVKHELTQAHGAGWNYWDSLFIRKDLI